MNTEAIVLIVVLIAVVVWLTARQSLRRDDQSGRGSEPGKGSHVLSSDYSSGLGNSSASWTVPRDPQDYAKRFIPKDKMP